jgi:hypothetical protein
MQCVRDVYYDELYTFITSISQPPLYPKPAPTNGPRVCGCRVTRMHKIARRKAQKGQMEMASQPSADNQRINGLDCDCDCDHGREKIRVRCYALVAASASRPVLLSVSVSCTSPNPSSTTLNQNQSRTTTFLTRIRTLNWRQTRLMNWYEHFVSKWP